MDQEGGAWGGLNEKTREIISCFFLANYFFKLGANYFIYLLNFLNLFLLTDRI